jgi:hypothetical protein
MASKNLESLVRGVRVASDVAVNVQAGSKPVFERATRLSHPRRLSLSLRTTGNQPGARHYPVDPFDADTAIRTGRSGRPVGVLVRRCLAMIAGRTVLSGRFSAVGGPTLTADGCFGLFAKPPAAGGGDLPACPLPWQSHQPGERQQSSPAWFMPAMRTSTASTRGTQDR